MIMMPWLILALCSLTTPVFAQSNGMDMSMDVPMGIAVGNMLPYAHFTPGDTVWFAGWVPSSGGAMVGTCFGLFLLSILERWLATCLELAEQHWVESTRIMALKKSDAIFASPASSPSPTSSSSPSSKRSKPPRLPPFVAEVDVTRGVLFAAHWSIKILLMMAVMTFQLSFLLSVSIGSGVGETLFGRFSSSLHDH